DYSLSYAREDSEGYRHTDPELNNVNAQLGYEFADKVRADLYFTWDNVWRETGGALKSWALEERRQNNPPVSLTEPARVRPNEQDHNLLSEGIAFKYDRDNWLLKTSFDYSHFDDVYYSLQYYNFPGNSLTTQQGQGCYKDDRDEDKLNFKISGGRTFTDNDKLLDTLILGYDYAGDDFKQARSYPYATSLSTSTQTKIKKNNIKYTRDINGIFANNEFKYDKWGLRGGLRYDFVDYDVKNEVPKSIKKKFKELSWDIAPSYSITPESNLYFSRSRNFWYPNNYYFTAAMDSGSAENQPQDLKPEIYDNYEIGFKHRLAKFLNYNIALFHTYVENKYMPYYDSAGKYKGYKHVGDSIHQGVELGADGRPLEWFGYRLGFTWLNAEWDKGQAKACKWNDTSADTTEVMDISGKKLYRVPDYQYLVGLDFNPLKKLTLSLDIHGFGEQWVDALNRIKDGAVTLVDMKAKYAFSKNFEMYIAGSNIFDLEYESIFNTKGKRNSDKTLDNDYYPKNGRYFEIGGTIKF
ncbi:MAG: TonB-dependent receptor, partial [Candidatus Omnitrophota bacterium]|nr:TonB-dependent receptor [Candidatus Omnitrophota bacterium]